jgi:hypothetical protein
MSQKSSTATGKLARALLAGTCLATAGGVASAGTFSEGPTDLFPNSFDPASVAPVTVLIPVGDHVVTGQVGVGGDNADFFEFTGLLPSGAYSLQISYLGGANWTVNTYTSAGSGLGSAILGEGACCNPITGTIPIDGKLLVRGSSGEGTPDYTMTLTAPVAAAVPEPSTLALSGLAVASAFAWRRKRKQ